jgi:hypothetical protein
MKNVKYTYPALITALIALVSLAAGIIVSLATQNPILLIVSVGFIIAAATAGIFVIIETVQEKRDDKSDASKVTTATKSAMGRIRISEGPLTIEAPDAESAIKMLQVIFQGKSSLKGELGLTVEVKEPEGKDAPETKNDEE